mmetsp:Transcript_6370/g.7311  ORF Transcript_6370/g.7311 Transcript_6370/m.7311 type:complete len:105 (+) Transcript_6370:1133-1447(+)
MSAEIVNRWIDMSDMTEGNLNLWIRVMRETADPWIISELQKLTRKRDKDTGVACGSLCVPVEVMKGQHGNIKAPDRCNGLEVYNLSQVDTICYKHDVEILMLVK